MARLISGTIPVILALTSFTSCNSSRGRGPLYSEVRTDLGPEGNQLVADEFSKYKEKAGGCVIPAGTNSNLKRAIITGFGPFQNKPFNISGVIAATMASSSMWSGVVGSNVDSSNLGSGVASGKTSQGDRGGKAAVRTIEVGDRKYLVCIILLDVKWDLAASIISLESQRFGPNIVVMMGQGGQTATFEGGAINRATQYNGFDSEGSDLGSGNVPIASGARILANHPDVSGAPHQRSMTWNNVMLRDALKERVQDLGYSLTYEGAARSSNDYICNNVSYVVLTALAGESLSLAGGKIVLPAQANSAAKAGFFHLPANATNNRSEIISWAAVLASVVDTQIAP